MRGLLLILAAIATPGFAGDLRFFNEIREKDRIALVLPAGGCRATVVSRDLYGLTVRINDTTAACGKRKSLATISRVDVEDVVGERGAAGPPGMSRSAHCAVIAATVSAVTVGFAIGARTGSNWGVVPVVVGSGAAAGFLCRSRGPRYTVFSERIVN